MNEGNQEPTSRKISFNHITYRITPSTLGIAKKNISYIPGTYLMEYPFVYRIPYVCHIENLYNTFTGYPVESLIERYRAPYG